MFGKTDYASIAGKSRFLSRQVRTVLSNDQLRQLTEAFVKEVMGKKESFIKTKETDVLKLKLALQSDFTKLVIKRINIELAKVKNQAEAKLDDLVEMDKKRHKQWDIVGEKEADVNSKVAEAKTALADLLDAANTALL